MFRQIRLRQERRRTDPPQDGPESTHQILLDEFTKAQLADAPRRKSLGQLKDLADNLAPPPDFTLEIEYPDKTLTPLETRLYTPVRFAQWEFCLFCLRDGFAAAHVSGEGTFPFGRHRHPTEERILVRRGQMTEEDYPDILLTQDYQVLVPPLTWHSPIIVDGCELYIEWWWDPARGKNPPTFAELWPNLPSTPPPQEGPLLIGPNLLWEA